jgi:outer membrane protein assembly factor BamB
MTRRLERPRSRTLLGSAALVLLFSAGLLRGSAAPPAPSADWPQWRGPNGAGIGEGTYPDRWSATEHIAWRTELPGKGHSSPAVSGDRVFVTTAIEGAEIAGWKAPLHLGFDRKPGYVNPDSTGVGRMLTLKVYALQATTGKVLWERTSFEGPPYDDRHRSNTYASSTIATDGSLLFVSFEAAGFYAYDVAGSLKWKVDLGAIAKGGLGPGTSPLLYGALVILQCDQEMGEGSFVAAFEKATGKEVWRAPRTTRRSWATPLLVTAGGRDELITSGAETVIAYDPKTGKELWTAPGVVSHPIPSYVAGKGLVFATAGSQTKVVEALRPGPLEAGVDRVAWKYNKGAAYVTSPIFYRDYLYLVTDAGLMTCLDPVTGAVVYDNGRVPVPATIRSSAVAFGDRILLTSEEGETFVIKAGPKHEVLATNSVGEPVWASLALARGMVFIRGDRQVFGIK